MNSGILRLALLLNIAAALIGFFAIAGESHEVWAALIVVLAFSLMYWGLIRVVLWVYDGFAGSEYQRAFTLNKCLALILLVPVFLSIISFFRVHFFESEYGIFSLSVDDGIPGWFSPGLTIYIGLLALAGAYLFSEKGTW